MATLTNLAIFLPDWHSLDSVRRAHNDLEGWALAFFALLVGFDVLAHFSSDETRKKGFEKVALACFAIAIFAEIVAFPYGLRNDNLSEQIIGSLDAKAREAATNASAALANSTDAETKSADAVSKAGTAQTKAAAADADAGQAQKKADVVSGQTTELTRELAKNQ